MSENQKNGHQALPPNMVQAPVVTAEQAVNVLEQAMGAPMTILLKGVQASFPGFPPGLIMLAACRVMGHLVGGSFSGQNVILTQAIKARTECKEMFEKAIKEVPITMPNGGSSQPSQPLPPKPQG